MTCQTVCTRCVMDTTDPMIRFDDRGECQYCRLFDSVSTKYPGGEEGMEELKEICRDMKRVGTGRAYDCVVGVSGGTDSTYSLYLTVQLGLRPLAVHFDNGWNSETAVTNIHNACTKLGVDLYTHVVNWEEFKDVQLSFLKASTPDMEVPSDMGINGTLYRVAHQENVRYIVHGHSFRTEGKVPLMWSYGDGLYLRKVHERFGSIEMKTLPNLTLWQLFHYEVVRRIRKVRILYYVDYQKDEIKNIITRELDWKDYGGHHYESIYTRFYQGSMLPKKFGFDKRKRELSALVRSGQMVRVDALRVLETEPPMPPELERSDRIYVIKKLGLTEAKFDELMNLPRKTFMDYPNYYRILWRFRSIIKFFYGFVSYTTPMILDESMNLTGTRGDVTPGSEAR